MDTQWGFSVAPSYCNRTVTPAYRHYNPGDAGSQDYQREVGAACPLRPPKVIPVNILPGSVLSEPHWKGLVDAMGVNSIYPNL